MRLTSGDDRFRGKRGGERGSCGSLNVWSAADKDLSFEHHQLQEDVPHFKGKIGTESGL